MYILKLHFVLVLSKMCLCLYLVSLFWDLLNSKASPDQVIIKYSLIIIIITFIIFFILYSHPVQSEPDAWQ